MTENEINKKAYQLLKLLEEKNTPQVKQEPEKEIVGIPMILKLSNVKEIKRSTAGPDKKQNSIYASSKGKEVGISPKNYAQIRELASEILQSKYFEQNTDAEFVEKEIFQWLLNSHRQQKASEDLMNYLYSKVESELKEYVFYFKVIACGIEHPFRVGRVDISFFTQEAFNFHRENFLKLGKPEEEFNFIFKEFDQRVLAVYKHKAVEGKARKIAMREVGLSMNALKCLLLEESISPGYQLLDVDFRLDESGFSSYLTETTSEKFDFTHSLFRERGIPTEIDSDKLQALNARGLKSMNHFLENNKRQSESYWIGERCINQLGVAAATWNHHERVVKITSLFDSVLIPDGSKRAKGQTLLKKNVVPIILSADTDKEDVNKLINKMYDTRDKYLHNAIELSIDLYELHKFQHLALIFVLKILALAAKTTSLEEIQATFGISYDKK